MSPDLTRRQALRLGGRLAAAGGIGALAVGGAVRSLAPQEDAGKDVLGRELRIGYLPITDGAALLTAHEGGFLSRNGIRSARPVLFRSWESLAQAFVAGEVDAVHLLMPFAVQLRLARKAPLKVVAWGHTNGSALTVSPEITRTEQLAGTTVAIPYWWSVHSVLLQRLLTDAGLTPVIRETPSAAAGTVQLAVMAPAEMVPALAAGRIGGFVVADPFSAVAEAKKVGRVHRFLGDVWHDHGCCAITVREDLIDSHPGAVTGLTTALVQAQQWLDGHRSQAATEVLAGAGKYLPQPPAAVTKVLTRTPAAYASVTSHPTWHGERIAFSPYPFASYTTSLVEAMRTTKVDGDASFLRGAEGPEVHAGLVDDRFVRSALRATGQRVPSPDRTEQIEP
ncbi:ABC transporter substrate-binding protein [Actinomycetota bacterium]